MLWLAIIVLKKWISDTKKSWNSPGISCWEKEKGRSEISHNSDSVRSAWWTDWIQGTDGGQDHIWQEQTYAYILPNFNLRLIPRTQRWTWRGPVMEPLSSSSQSEHIKSTFPFTINCVSLAFLIRAARSQVPTPTGWQELHIRWTNHCSSLSEFWDYQVLPLSLYSGCF